MWLVWIFGLLTFDQFFSSYVTFMATLTFVVRDRNLPSLGRAETFGLHYLQIKRRLWLQMQLEPRIQLTPGHALSVFTPFLLAGFVLSQTFFTHGRENGF